MKPVKLLIVPIISCAILIIGLGSTKVVNNNSTQSHTLILTENVTPQNVSSKLDIDDVFKRVGTGYIKVTWPTGISKNEDKNNYAVSWFSVLIKTSDLSTVSFKPARSNASAKLDFRTQWKEDPFNFIVKTFQSNSLTDSQFKADNPKLPTEIVARQEELLYELYEKIETTLVHQRVGL